MLVASGVLAGCGLGAGSTPTAVRLDVTRAFGAQPIRSLPAPRTRGQETAMSLLMRNAAVSTRYGGGFVESIDGRAGGYEDGQPLDWFYYVNGVTGAKGAAETTLHSGDRVWWDLHNWSQSQEVPAVVGSFPEPFLNGVQGRPLPVRVECAGSVSASCRTVAARLRGAGVASTIAAFAGGHPPPHALRVLVGVWSRLRADAGAQQLERGPRASGVYARVARSGEEIALLDAQGQVTRTLGADAGLIAATRYADGEPEWLITGGDAAGVASAARSLTESTLRDRFAVALAAGAVLPLPQPSP